MLRGRRDRYHRLGFLIPFTVAAIATPIQMAVGDALARWVYNNEPVKFAAIELVPETDERRARDAARAPELGRHGQRRDPRSRASRRSCPIPSDGHEHGRPGPRHACPADDRPTIAAGRTRVHLAWDVMVGLGTLLFLLSLWYGVELALPARHARRRSWFLRIASCAGVLAVIAMEAGWVVTEVGRQPWIVLQLHEGRGRGDRQRGRLDHVPRRRRPLRRVGVTTILVLRGMSRRFRRERATVDESDVPYGPAPTTDRPRARRSGRMSVSDAVAVVLFVGVTAYALFGGADFGAGFWDLIAGGAERGERPRAVIDHSIGPVWEANHVWLIFCLVVLWTAFSEAFASITLTLFVPLTLAALGIVLRGSSFAFRKAVFAHVEISATSAPRSPSRRCSCRSAWARSPARSRRAGCPPAARPATRGRAGSTPPRSSAACSRSPCRAYLAAVYLVWDARRLADDRHGRVLPRAAPSVAAVVAGVVAFVGIFVLHADARYVFDGLTSRALPLVILPPLCGVGSLVLLLPTRPPRRPRRSRSARSRRRRRPGASRSGPTCCPSR